MNNDFVNTKNVQAFLAGLSALNNGVGGRMGMMLAFGKPGTGKTCITQRQACEDRYVYIRCKYVDTPRNLLQAIVAELGEEPKGYTGKLFEQAREQLVEKPRVLMMDEIDYLVDHKGMIEIVRDLNDMANTPIILIGMEHVDKKLQRFPHLFDRIRAIVRFDLFDQAEIKSLGQTLCEAELDDTAIEYIHHQSGGKIRITMDLFDLAERLAKNNRLKSVSGLNLKASWEKQKKRTRS